MDLTLYRVIGSQNRVALGGLADGVEYYNAEQADDGVITLTPVRIVTGQALQLNAPAATDEAPDDPAPFA